MLLCARILERSTNEPKVFGKSTISRLLAVYVEQGDNYGVPGGRTKYTKDRNTGSLVPPCLSKCLFGSFCFHFIFPHACPSFLTFSWDLVPTPKNVFRLYSDLKYITPERGARPAQSPPATVSFLGHRTGLPFLISWTLTWLAGDCLYFHRNASSDHWGNGLGEHSHILCGLDLKTSKLSAFNHCLVW